MQERVKQQIMIKDRASVEVDAVKNIRAFDSDSVVIELTDGRLIVEGEDLKIESLDKNAGKLHLTGEINAVIYPKGISKKKGIFK